MMMPLTSLRKINAKDERFRISFSGADGLLLSSIGKAGIIQPVVLFEQDPSIIVSGFRRIEAAKKSGIRKIPAVTACLNEKEGLFFAVHDNLSRGLNLVEKASALSGALRFSFSQNEMHDLLDLLSLGHSEKVLALLLSLARSEQLLRRFVVRHALSLKNIEYMLWFAATDRKRIINSLDSVKITESSLREILEMLHLLKIKKGRFAGRALRSVTTSTALHADLKKIVYPKLTSLERKLELILKSAALPPGLDIRVDPFFEKEYIDIAVRAKSETELEALLFKLQSTVEKGYFRRILELTKGRVR
jgi:hypothetical protein